MESLKLDLPCMVYFFSSVRQKKLTRIKYSNHSHIIKFHLFTNSQFWLQVRGDGRALIVKGLQGIGDLQVQKFVLGRNQTHNLSHKPSKSQSSYALAVCYAVDLFHLFNFLPFHLIFRALLWSALMVTVFLGTRYLVEMDRQNNDVPVANLTGLGW